MRLLNSAPNIYGGLQQAFNPVPQEIFAPTAPQGPQTYMPPPMQLMQQNIPQPLEFNHPPPSFLNKPPMIGPETSMMNLQVPPPIFNPPSMTAVPLPQTSVSASLEQLSQMINDSGISKNEHSRYYNFKFYKLLRT